jgi:SAM-dependent methyltransferase
VTGVDYGDGLICAAKTLADHACLGARSDFILSDVTDSELPLSLNDQDLVYTGKGSLHWLTDLGAWGQTVHDILAPGGSVFVMDLHPALWLFAPDGRELRYTGVSYFAPRIRYDGWGSDHLQGAIVESGIEKEIRPWPPSAVMQALIDAGMVASFFGEFSDARLDPFSAYRGVSKERRGKVPAVYAIAARRRDDREN